MRNFAVASPDRSVSVMACTPRIAHSLGTGPPPHPARPDPEVTERAATVALEHLASTSRRAAVREVVASFASAAARAYSDRMSLSDTFLVYQSLADRGEDRARFQAGLERAVVAVILWDELSDDDLAALLGPWATFVETALGG